MSAQTITPVGPDPATTGVTHSDVHGGGAGRGGDQNPSQSPLVVVQGGRQPSPPRPAPNPSPANADTSLRNGYAAISHSVSGETAAIGVGFLVAGPVGAIVGGATLPALVAASMWRARRREHDDNANDGANGPGSDSSSSDRPGSGSGRGRNNGGGAGNRGGGAGPGGGTKTPKNGAGLGDGAKKKPKTKDPVADKLSKAGKALADKLKNRGKNNPLGKDDKKGPLHKAAKDAAKDKAARDKAAKDAAKKTGKDKSGVDPKNTKTPKTDKGTGTDKAKDRKWPKDRGPQPASDKPWRGRGTKNKPEKARKDPKDRRNTGGKDHDTPASTAPDGLDPNKRHRPKKPRRLNRGTDTIDDRIELIKARRERDRRRRAIKTGKKAADDAARDGTYGDPHQVKLERIREENRKVDLELHNEHQLLALAAATEHRRSHPVTYPVATTQTPGTRTAGVAVARQIDPRGSAAYKLLVAMAEQLANGLHNDDDADMADHVVELVGIPALCRNLGLAVREAAAALQKTAPLHPSVIKHINNASVAAMTAARMADTILIVFVQAHREDIQRVIAPRLGEERWNIRNAPGTLDAAKLRSAISSAGQQRLALPAGRSAGATTHSSGKIVPASHNSTKRLIQLMKGFDRGHMTVCLSEVAGAARGVDIVADAITKLYRRMAKTWPTEQVVDDTVRATASKVKTITTELHKAIKAAQRAHERELRLNAKPRKGPSAEKKWDVVSTR